MCSVIRERERKKKRLVASIFFVLLLLLLLLPCMVTAESRREKYANVKKNHTHTHVNTGNVLSPARAYETVDGPTRATRTCRGSRVDERVL